ncbi:MAG: hypothetical protein QM736_02925 [Vicinamibacterales bacterium]
MQILDEQHERTHARHVEEERRQLALHPLLRRVLQPFLTLERLAPSRRQRRDVDEPGRRDVLHHLGESARERRPHQVVHQLEDRQVRFTARETLRALPSCDERTVRRPLEIVDRLLDERRLADARLADHCSHEPASARNPLEQQTKPALLALASDDVPHGKGGGRHGRHHHAEDREIPAQSSPRSAGPPAPSRASTSRDCRVPREWTD